MKISCVKHNSTSTTWKKTQVEYGKIIMVLEAKGFPFEVRRPLWVNHPLHNISLVRVWFFCVSQFYSLNSNSKIFTIKFWELISF